MSQPLRAFAAAAHVITVLVITNIAILIVQWTTLTTGSQYHYRPPYKQHHSIQGYPPSPSFWHIFECFDRIGVGKSLNETDVNRTVTVKTSRECEMECDKDKCQTYAFGIGAAGNGTCEISLGVPTELPVEDIEYDLYTRNSKCKNKTTSCFRRLAPGRKLIDRYIRKTLQCESLRQCEEDCAQEWSFYCEGFSFRFDPRGSICQLTSVPSDKLMILKDFNADRDWDFFERDKNAPKNCYRPLSGLRPWTQYGNSGPGTAWHRYDKPPPPPSYHHHPAPAPAPPPAQPPTYRPPQNWGFSSGDYGAKPDYSFGGGNSYYGFKDTFATGEGFPNSLQPVPPPPVQTPQQSSNECFIRRKVGFRLDRNVVVLSLTAPSLYHCELECANEKKFLCNIFSYRYTQSNSIPGDNCHLGERAFHTLDFYTDLLPDRDYDLYVRNEKGPPVCIPRRSSDSDCFERVRSGLRLHNSMTKTNMMAHSISDCEQACVNSKRFTCRAFSYRYGPPTIGQDRENCQLTDHPIPELNPTKHFVDDPNCELYHRGSYGHGCELDKWNYYQPPPSFNRPTGPDPSYYIPPPKHGYIPPSYGQGNVNRPSYPQKPSGYLPPPYHPPSSTNDPATIGTPSGGGYGFSEYPMYNPPPTNSIQPTYGLPSNPPPPPSPSYIPSTGPPQGGNGGTQMYLPPPSSFGGSSNGGSSYNTGTAYGQGGGYAHGSVYGHGNSYNHGDWNSGYGHTGGTGHGGTGHGGTAHGGSAHGGSNYGHGTGYGLSSKDKICYLGYGSPARLMPSAVRSSLLVSNEFECKTQCSQARETSHFRCASLSFRGNNCELSDIEQRDLRPGVDFNHDVGYWLFSWDFTDAQCYSPPKGNIPPPSGPNSFTSGGMEGTWQRFTVSGQPCKAGTVCTQNRDVGIWSCPIEGLNGDWDYCCRSGHYCGYSEGFNYPWCYVGSATKDQWRPCSEHYFPYPHSNRPQHWPVAYLHREGPPNMTTEYQPSIVDNFLETLRQDTQKISGSNNSSIPDLQVVDVTPNPRKDTKTDESAITKLWMWGNSKFNTTESVETTENLVTTEISTTTVNEETSTVSV